MSVRRIFYQYIKGTGCHGNIPIFYIFVCMPNEKVQKVISNEGFLKKVFMSSKSLKHIYDRHIFDKKVPEDFYTILNNVKKIISNPDRIYRNHVEKRGDYIFVKSIESKLIMCTLEIINSERIETVSASVTGEKYLSKFALLWSWGTANSPS